MKYFISIIVAIVAFSCKTANEDTEITSFGGEIINPKTDFVLFLKEGSVIDTLFLDSNNRFINNYKSLVEGLYTFKHGTEFQYVYIQPKDSILVRLNTWDFDESLVFSGKGSDKNEFLINLFLQNEKEEKNMYQYFNLNEYEFQHKIDSLSNERIEIFNKFSSERIQKTTDGFKKLTTSAINFPLYRLKEMYPFFYKKAHKLNKFPKISKEFYNFRKDISLNEDNLIAFYPYQNYVVYYLYNLSYQLKEKDSTKNNLTVNILNATVDHIKSEKFKNTLLKRILVNDFLKSESTCSINEDALNLFINNCTNQEYITQVEKLVNDSKTIKNKEPLHNFNILSYNNKIATINDVIKHKNSVIYFWSTNYMSSDYLVKRIKYLETNFPNILFIGINMQNTSEDLTSEPNLKNLDISKQFKLTKNSEAHKYFTSNYPRTIIIDKNGIVKNGFTYLDSRKLHSELTKLK
ncbi:MAG: hypothetical protein QM495_02355 [Lutibacter sp.]|uniref:hypothetical protein n=1 Tax=Lutibacter sp. TaxID=1925666 RepID=UPI0038580ADA